MQIESTILEGCFVIKPNVFYDERGYFVETFNEHVFQQMTGLSTRFVQDNESCSCKNVVRGLHFQKGIYAQTKLVRVVQGCILDIAVDIRMDSPTFLQHVAVELNAKNKHQLYVPVGFAHGFAVLEDNTIVNYKCDHFYHKEADGGIHLHDTTLGIVWPVPITQQIISVKDSQLPFAKDIDWHSLFA